MHACRVTSESSTRARLMAKRDHADRRANTKPEQRIRKANRREFRAKRATPSAWHSLRLHGNRLALLQGLIYVRVQRECEHTIPSYLVGLGHWARWVNAQQGV